MRSPWRLLLGILCVALVLLSGTLSVTHSHPDINHAECGLCVSAHTVAQATVAPIQILIAVVMGPVEITVRRAVPRTIFRFALFTRPPPANANLS